ncbi:MAG: TetR/AcrR family transcriptional regulator [Pseudomonadota bacterium]
MPKAGYHHGNLRQALVEAALEVIATDGATGFTLARAAKAAGVTPAAVYRHFKGRDDLLAEIARQGHERLALLTDTATKDLDAGLGAVAYCSAFITFAETFPGYFTAIYLSGISLTHSPALEAASTQNVAVRVRLAERLCRDIVTPSADDMAAHLHAFCIGTVLTGPKAARAVTETLQSGMQIYLKGLGVEIPLD